MKIFQTMIMVVVIQLYIFTSKCTLATSWFYFIFYLNEAHKVKIIGLAGTLIPIL